MKKFKVFANGYKMGVFEATDVDAALEAYAQEAGYQSVADMEEQLGSDAEYDAVEVEASASDKTEEDTKMKKFKVVVNHFTMGIFSAEDEAGALEAWAQDAGYQSFADMNEQTETKKPDEYEVVEMDADALEAYAQKAGYETFADMEEQLG